MSKSNKHNDKWNNPNKRDYSDHDDFGFQEMKTKRRENRNKDRRFNPKDDDDNYGDYFQ